MSTTPETNSETTKPRSCARGCLITFFLVVAVLIGLYAYEGPLPTPPLWQIERVTSVNFPPSARVIRSHGRTFLETSVWAKIEIDKADSASFIKSLPADSEITDPDEKSESHLAQDWGDTYKVKQSRLFKFEKSHDNGHNEVREILIKLDDPQNATVYLLYAYY